MNEACGLLTSARSHSSLSGWEPRPCHMALENSEGHQALGSVALKFTVGLCGADFRSGMAEGTG